MPPQLPKPEPSMTEFLLILGYLAFRELVRELPAIIWAIRCPAASPNYRLPATARRRRAG
jgi:hypothetical protein